MTGEKQTNTPAKRQREKAEEGQRVKQNYEMEVKNSQDAEVKKMKSRRFNTERYVGPETKRLKNPNSPSNPDPADKS